MKIVLIILCSLNFKMAYASSNRLTATWPVWNWNDFYTCFTASQRFLPQVRGGPIVIAERNERGQTVFRIRNVQTGSHFILLNGRSLSHIEGHTRTALWPTADSAQPLKEATENLFNSIRESLGSLQNRTDGLSDSEVDLVWAALTASSSCENTFERSRKHSLANQASIIGNAARRIWRANTSN